VYYDFFPDKKLSVNLPQKDGAEIKIPSEEEISKIYKACAGTRYELPILLAMDMGLRASEIRGLKWDCVDGDVLHIRNAMVDAENGPALKKPKSTSGHRTLHMPKRIKELIEATPRTSEFVVTMSGQAMEKGFYRLCEANGIPHYRFHDLRHVFASVSIALNIPTEYIRKDMGHKSDRMIRAVYGHMMDEKRKEHADRRAEYYENFLSQKLDADIAVLGYDSHLQQITCSTSRAADADPCRDIYQENRYVFGFQADA
jgi:integrase